jgi:hypothetical protein
LNNPNVNLKFRIPLNSWGLPPAFFLLAAQTHSAAAAARRVRNDVTPLRGVSVQWVSAASSESAHMIGKNASRGAVYGYSVSGADKKPAAALASDS